eukprot:CAMPEP_0170627238 /NCGR_PEP_ID=MMETSP0224-20130122/31859_1 /TAXON_ID=285029 /ORGANISM="Togula jolla, Strain CCCM 725" /LENGTH=107 /DNA_ID=CAMNT_0010954213 /DNA_START=420 /DNA_END=740 /DNA_ORIENTATION=+
MAARCKGLSALWRQLSDLAAEGSACISSSSCTISRLPLSTASTKGGEFTRRFGSAPDARSSAQILAAPLLTAAARAELPLRSLTFGSALSRSSWLTRSKLASPFLDS